MPGDAAALFNEREYAQAEAALKVKLRGAGLGAAGTVLSQFIASTRMEFALGADDELLAFYERIVVLPEITTAAPDGGRAEFLVRLATQYAYRNQFEAGVQLLRGSLAVYEARLGLNDEATRRIRDTLAIHLRNLDRKDEASALFAVSGVCEHLEPVERYVRSLGVRVAWVGSPWSRNCRNWVVFDLAVLDADALRKRFSLPPTVVVHTHRGTHDGNEHGLVCEEHWDALIGAHPDFGKGLRIIK